MRKNIVLNLIIVALTSLIFMSQTVHSQTLSGRVYEGTTGVEPPASKPMVGVPLKLYGSNDINMIGTDIISTTTTDSAGWYGLPVRGAFDFYNIVEENPAGYNSDGATSVSGTVKTADWIQYTYDQLSQTTTGNKFWNKQSVSPCKADFSASPRSGCAPLTVEFFDQSTNAQSWNWKFPGGNPSTSTVQNPTVTYVTHGSYSVSLRVTCTNGVVDSLTKTDYITADYCPTPCEAAFDASPRDGCAPLTVNFTDQSVNAQSWQWTFPGGNPSASTQSNPTVVYATPGTYGVQLKITCVTGQVDSVYQADYITVRDCGQSGRITVIKAATPPDSSVIFNFTGDLGNFTLTPTSNSKTFSNLAPGIYNIAENIPPGWNLGNYQITGDLDGGTTHDSLAATWAIDLDANEDITLVIYNYKPGEDNASVGDWVWHDLDQDGLQDQGEPGLDSVDVSLFDQNGNLLAMTLTTSTGFYMFSNINPGSYFINFSLRPGFAYSPPDQGMDDTIDSDAQFGTGNTPLFTLAAAEHNTNMDAGMYQGEGPDELDFGDAPDPNYPTLLTNNGARHIINPNFYLGSAIDAEPDGLQSANADGDNLNILNDEDGVTMLPFIVPGQAIPITAVASDSGVLNAWLDFNINGSWADAGEHFIAAQPVFPGANSFTLNVPSNAILGKSYARFRLSSVRNISYDGVAPDGEVEDYAVTITEGGGGSLTIIKNAMPKDNTPFWITIIYGAMGGAAPFRDPLSNSATISNGPEGIYHLGESVPAGWKLMDIIITGDVDNGSVVNLGAATANIDLDAGENITVTFKNEKTSGEQFDFGDAPDGTNHHGVGMEAYAGIPARFPTVFDPATGLPTGPIHRNPLGDAWLGNSFSLEEDADIMPDDDGLTNIDPPGNIADRDGRDDGVIFPVVLPSGQSTYFTYSLTIPPGSAGSNRYVNVWLDWNRDGDWEDILTFQNPNDAPEWAVQNQLIPAGFPPGVYVFATPLFLAYHPGNTETKPIWMRISLAEQPAPQPADGRGPAVGYEYGETEDYYFFADDTTTNKLYDFGDAPDDPANPGYPTLHAHGGAYHTVVDGFHLGNMIDPEINGQPDPAALGDDNINIDDEDGVSFLTPLIPGQQASVEVVASSNGILNAWIDYNANSSWMESNEHVFIDISVSAGNNPLSFNVPVTAVPGVTFTRFRLSRVPGVMSTGYGRDGEVEDYEVGIEQGGEGPPIKWRQIPLVNRDSDMPYTPYFFGWDVRTTYDGTYVADDWFCKSPRPVTEIHWWGSYTEWDSALPPRVAPHAFHIGIWTDVPKGEDTDWSHPGEMIRDWTVAREMAHEHVVGNDFHPEYMSKPDTCFRYEFIIPPDQWFYQEGDSTIYWLSISALYEEEPDSFVWGWKTREHFFHDDAVYVYDPVTPIIGAVATKTEPIDEGWDLAFVLKTDEYFLEFDFGDAPFERYPTYFGQNGAHHIHDPNVFLGQHIDTEITGQPDHTCTGDDNDGMDDDDGIVFTAPTGDGATYVEVTASWPGYLNAWMDFDNNGSWAEPEDQIFRDEFIPSGQSILKVPIPDDAVPPPIFSRFRFSTEPGLSYVGIAIDGEVEDYLCDFGPVGVEQNETSIIPAEFRLYQNYPNPFNPETIIRFDLPTNKHSSYHVNLSIYNVRGQLIRILMDEDKSPGACSIKWDGRNNSGQKVNSGIYLLKIIADDYRAYQKMIILK